MKKEQGYSLARALILAGGILAILLGAINMVLSRLTLNLDLASSVLGLVVGIVSLVMINEIRNDSVAILLIVLGFISNSTGGVIVGIGAIIALLSKYIFTDS